MGRPTRHCGTTTARTRRREDGSMSVEIVLLAPILMMLVLLVVLCGRYVSVRGDIDAAARDAARAASMQVTLADANAVAQQVVDDSVSAGHTDCGTVGLTGSWRAGGRITVRLSCSVSYEGLGLLGMRGSTQMTTESVVPLDSYRRFG